VFIVLSYHGAFTGICQSLQLPPGIDTTRERQDEFVGGIQAQSFHTPSYTETGLIPNGFALTFNGRGPTDSNAVLALRGRVAWAHDWVSDPTLTPMFQSLPGASFIVTVRLR
jgi:hypothetical protein